MRRRTADAAAPPERVRSAEPAREVRRKRPRRPLRTHPALLSWVLVLDCIVLAGAWLLLRTSETSTAALHLALLSSITFLLFGADKWCAVRQKSRVSEFNLLALTILGGAAGALLGMGLFRHKTRRALFTITVLTFLFAQLVLLALLANQPSETA